MPKAFKQWYTTMNTKNEAIDKVEGISLY